MAASRRSTRASSMTIALMHPRYRTEPIDRGGVCLSANDVAVGSLADKPSQAKIHVCPLLSESGQNVAVPRMSAMCQKPTSLRVHLRSQQASVIDGKKPGLKAELYSVRV